MEEKKLESMKAGRRIRKAEQGDLPRLTEIYNQAILTRRCTCDTESFSAPERQQWFNEHQTDRFPIWVCETEGEVAGYCYLSPYRSGRSALRDVVEISYYVDFGYHGRGIGSCLMAYAVEKARQKGFRFLIAILLSCNSESILLLQKFGFSEWGVLPEIARLGSVSHSHLYYGRKL